MPDLSFLIIFGIASIILGFFLVALGMMRSIQESESSAEKVKGGGIILIGPIPIVFGSDKRYALILMILAVVLMLLALALYK